MIWDYFIYFAIASVVLWLAGALAAWKGRMVPALAATSIGLCVFLAYILVMWVTLERPPMRTMGETRLWYSFFLPLAGIIVYARWRYQWILSFSTILATVFIGINVFKPEIHTKAMMPALQSPWFAPHVIVYMFAYALFGAAALMAAYLLVKAHRATTALLANGEDDKESVSPSSEVTLSPAAAPISKSKEFDIIDNMVYVGWAFLTIGMLFGALWAKDAWGHYWAWDPKETWAAVTWFAYLVYMHYRLSPGHSRKLSLWILIGSFLLLQMCWWGINYLPSAQGTSIHTYNS